MPPQEQTAQSYHSLAQAFADAGDQSMRDRLLLLAADAYLTAGRADQAEAIRQQLLKNNPHHALKPHRSLAEALKAADVRNYVDGLRRHYPPEQLSRLAESVKKAKPQAVGLKGATRAGQDQTVSDGGALLPPVVLQSPPPLPKAKPNPSAATASPSLPKDAAPVQIIGGESSLRSSDVYAMLPPTASVSRRTVASPDRFAEHPGGWFALVLFWLVLLGGLSLAAYVLFGPFAL
jgi:hypothetical protein